MTIFQNSSFRCRMCYSRTVDSLIC